MVADVVVLVVASAVPLAAVVLLVVLLAVVDVVASAVADPAAVAVVAVTKQSRQRLFRDFVSFVHFFLFVVIIFHPSPTMRNKNISCFSLQPTVLHPRWVVDVLVGRKSEMFSAIAAWQVCEIVLHTSEGNEARFAVRCWQAPGWFPQNRRPLPPGLLQQ